MFIANTSVANGGRAITLLRGASSRMASYFYALFRLLRLKAPLIVTINQQQFRELKLGERERLAIIDINTDKFWKAIYSLCRAVFPAIRALRYCDKNEPAMDKIYLLVHRTKVALEMSVEALNDESLFESLANEEGLEQEMKEVYDAEPR